MGLRYGDLEIPDCPPGFRRRVDVRSTPCRLNGDCRACRQTVITLTDEEIPPAVANTPAAETPEATP